MKEDAHKTKESLRPVSILVGFKRKEIASLT